MWQSARLISSTALFIEMMRAWAPLWASGLGHTVLLYLQRFPHFPVNGTWLWGCAETQTVRGMAEGLKKIPRDHFPPPHKLTRIQTKHKALDEAVTFKMSPGKTYIHTYSICCHHSKDSKILCLGTAFRVHVIPLSSISKVLSLGADSFLELALSRLSWHPVCWLELLSILKIIFFVKSEVW